MAGSAKLLNRDILRQKLALKEHYKDGGVYSCVFIGKYKHFLDDKILPQKWNLAAEEKLEPPKQAIKNAERNNPETQFKIGRLIVNRNSVFPHI